MRWPRKAHPDCESWSDRAGWVGLDAEKPNSALTVLGLAHCGCHDPCSEIFLMVFTLRGVEALEGRWPGMDYTINYSPVVSLSGRDHHVEWVLKSAVWTGNVGYCGAPAFTFDTGSK